MLINEIKSNLKIPKEINLLKVDRKQLPVWNDKYVLYVCEENKDWNIGIIDIVILIENYGDKCNISLSLGPDANEILSETTMQMYGEPVEVVEHLNKKIVKYFREKAKKTGMSYEY